MIDLRTASFEDFVTFIFDHPAYEGQDVEVDNHRVVRIIEQRPPEWYWDVDWFWDDLPCDPMHVLALLTQLFTHAGDLCGRFTARQIDQGFGLLIGPGGSDVFAGQIWNEQLPWQPREELIRATLPLYRDLFDGELAMDHVPYMYWDMLLAYRYAEEPIVEPPSLDHDRIQLVVADVIRSQLLELNGWQSMPAALHGAHHVNHPIAFDAVRNWLADPANDDEFYRAYAEKVLVGDAM